MNRVLYVIVALIVGGVDAALMCEDVDDKPTEICFLAFSTLIGFIWPVWIFVACFVIPVKLVQMGVTKLIKKIKVWRAGA